LLEVHRFAHITFRAESVTVDAILLFIRRRENDPGNTLCTVIVTKAAKESQAVEFS
jgi:hypothetical protein